MILCCIILLRIPEVPMVPVIPPPSPPIVALLRA